MTRSGEGRREKKKGLRETERWMFILFNFKNDAGNHITIAMEKHNLLQTTKMYSNKVLFTCIQIKSLLKIKPI